ncbi:MAG: hypothetical protein V1701_02755 [Planctomycetota bacterium]
MSADNGIYIVKFPGGYRVAICGAVENIWFYPKGSEERKQELEKYFGKSRLFRTLKEAELHACKIGRKNATEYGIQYLGKYESFRMKPQGNN